MSVRTIGGKPIEEVFASLQMEIPGVLKKTEEKGQPYLEVEVLRKFFDSKVPIQNYDFEISELQYVADENSACFVCIGSLTVYDDNGVKVTTKAYVGSNDCPRKRDGSGFVEFAMSARNAAVHARKSCIEMYGCGRNQLNAAKEAARKEKHRQSYKDAPSGYGSGSRPANLSGVADQNAKGRCTNPKDGVESGNGRRMERPPYGNGNFHLVCPDVAKISNLPKMFLIPVKMLNYGGYETRLLVWKSSLKDADEAVGRIIPGQEFNCVGKYEPYGNSHRIVLSRFGGPSQ